jgi:hypothetical protein
MTDSLVLTFPYAQEIQALYEPYNQDLDGTEALKTPERNRQGREGDKVA